MLKALLRVRMTALGKWFTGATAKKGKQTKGSMIGFAFLMVYAFGAAGFGADFFFCSFRLKLPSRSLSP